MSMKGGGKGGSQVQESSDTKELAKIASEMQADYDTRWKPIRNQLITDVKDAGPERNRALGVANLESKLAFAKAKPIAERNQTLAGARPGSGRFNASMADMAANEGGSTAGNLVDANQAIDDQRIAGLMSLAQMGRGEQGAAIRGLSDVASMSDRQAEIDANQSLQNSQAAQNTLGLAAGLGLGAYNNKMYQQRPEERSGVWAQWPLRAEDLGDFHAELW